MAFTALKKYPNNGTVSVAAAAEIPATVANGTTWTSPLLPAGFGGAVFGATSDQIVTLQMQRYADLAGLIPVGPLASQVLAAATPGWVGASDGLPFVSFSLAIVNGTGTLANITNVAALTGPGSLP